MKNKNNTSDSGMKINRILLKIAGIIKTIGAVGYALMLIIIAATGKISETIDEIGNNVDLGGISPEVAFYVGFGILILINALYAFFCFRALKPGSKPIALMIISIVAIVCTEFTRTGGGLLSGNFSWAYVIPTIINLTVFGCAFQTYRYNKSLEK